MVRPFHKIVVLHMLYLFPKCVNVVWVQSSDRNMDESIFRTIYIIVRASFWIKQREKPVTVYAGFRRYLSSSGATFEFENMSNSLAMLIHSLEFVL